MWLTKVRDYCKSNNLVYVYGVFCNECVTFCTVNTESLTYTLYEMTEDDVKIVWQGVSTLMASFKKEVLLGMGGELIENIK